MDSSSVFFSARETMTACEQKRRVSMLSMVVYRGQWFPKCDAEGMFEPEQCDNTGRDLVLVLYGLLRFLQGRVLV